MDQPISRVEIVPDSAVPGVCCIWLSNPGRHNALTDTMAEQLAGAFRSLDRDEACRAIVLRGRGGSFCAGRDVTATAGEKSADARRRLESMQALGQAIEACDTPTVAVVEGYAIGVGVSLALWCDFAFATDESVFAVPEVMRGIVPSLTGLALLQRIARRQAIDFILSGRRFSAHEATASGIVTRTLPTATLDQTVAEILRELCQRSPDAIAGSKRLIRQTADLAGPEAVRLAFEIGLASDASADASEGMAAFREKRRPEWPSMRRGPAKSSREDDL